ncbi:glutathione S-transferase family protein [Bradyrhizobium elkanii]|uniref:Glutathione S-transferase n=1 Tax=Bradyrhizobium elkanii TaxID=29448 RepID=A0A8I2C608_BRAEL|nr:glutathione S-transferase family protein [Bradyrhizobium elkanii]MBP1296379.1 glutathione S-transferase [Bradyrhizobium elkanii]
MLRLYDSRLSGNAWKVRILLTQLGLPFERVTLDLAKGATADPAFRAKSRFARVPVLELEDGRTIVESAAIMFYLAEGTPLLPDDRFLRAEVMGWLTFEQADLLRALALPRFYNLRGIAGQMATRIADFQEGAYPALDKAEAWLSTHDWLVAERYTIADIGLFGYVSMAHQGGYEMQRFPSIDAWIARVKAQPAWVPLVEETKS